LIWHGNCVILYEQPAIKEKDMADSKSVLTIDDASFDRVISNGVTLVDFWAEWCMPCIMQTPIMEEVARKIGDSVTISKMNVDENPNSASKYGIMGIPTSIVFKDGQEVQRFVGVQNEQILLKAIKSHSEG
jgi:thioredoxin 1